VTDCKLLENLKLNPFVLAPMAGITDSPFRSFMKEMGAGIVISELVSAHGIRYGGERTLKLLNYSEAQRPVGMQIFGEDPQIMADAALFVQDLGADFVDLNFGCPVPKVVKKGAGSALLKDLTTMTHMISAIKRAIQIPLTIKIRTGWDQNQRTAHEIAQLAFDEGVAWVAIHGRTRAQGYSGLADWDFITEVKSRAKLPIIGNGDIQTAAEAISRLENSACDGVMIGRGALKNPWIFLECLEQWAEGARDFSHRLSKEERTSSYALNRLFSYITPSCDEQIQYIQLKKFASWYSTGFPGASKFRKDLFQSKGLEDVQSVISSYFSEIKNICQQDTRSEPFLMGGHG